MTELIKSIKTVCQDIHLELPITDEELQTYDEQTLITLLDYCQQWQDCFNCSGVDYETERELLDKVLSKEYDDSYFLGFHL